MKVTTGPPGGGLFLRLYGAASGTHDQLGFVVEDVESMVARLRSNGVIFEEYEPPPGASTTDGIMDFGGIKAAWFKDSEGNLLSIVEFVFIAKGVAHGFTNAGQEPARCPGIVAPGGLHEKLLSSLGESAKAETLPLSPEGPPDAERFAAIMREYDTDLLPPPGQ